MITHGRAVGSTGAVLVLLIPTVVALSIVAPFVAVIGGPTLIVAGGVTLRGAPELRTIALISVTVGAGLALATVLVLLLLVAV